MHQSTATLLAVPQYCDLLGNQEDEDEAERGQLLVSSRAGWWTEMAKWIGDARAAENEEMDDEAEEILAQSVGNTHSSAWKPTTLAVLFGGLLEQPSRLPNSEIDAEAVLMEALANVEEDERLDEGAVEIDTEEEYVN